MSTKLERRPEKLPPGNSWEYDNRNVLLRPDLYKFHTPKPTGVLKDFADFLQIEMVRPEWELRDVLVTNFDDLAPMVAAVFNHPTRDILSPVKNENSRDDHALGSFVRTHTLEGLTGGKVKLDIAPIFDGTEYQVASKDANLNILGYEFRGTKRKNILWSEPDIHPEYWMQLGVGFVVVGLEHFDHAISKQQQGISGVESTRDFNLRWKDSDIAKLEQELVRERQKRSDIVDRYEKDVEERQLVIATLAERKANATKSLR
jgi:hypothetical protein